MFIINYVDLANIFTTIATQTTLFLHQKNSRLPQHVSRFYAHARKRNLIGKEARKSEYCAEYLNISILNFYDEYQVNSNLSNYSSLLKNGFIHTEQILKLVNIVNSYALCGT